MLALWPVCCSGRHRTSVHPCEIIRIWPCLTCSTPPKISKRCSRPSASQSLEELFACIPESLRLRRPLDLPPALSELELTQHMQSLASRNAHAGREVCFLGGGSYDHFIPAVVDALASRSEFYTSYTPYQPEASQGNLQAMFEYQTLICQLTGMDVSNASLYDGGSAAAEAALLCMSATAPHGQDRDGRQRPSRVSPDPRHVSGQPGHRAGHGRHARRDVWIRSRSPPRWTTRPPACCCSIRTSSAAWRRSQALAEIAHAAGALLVLVVRSDQPGLAEAARRLRAPTSSVAEGQSLGSPMPFGGPYLGIMACREQFVRRMPGRLAGQTVDRRGRRCWVLTLQTREQHIRREKATSNICTNQGLFALRAAGLPGAHGPAGLARVAELCLQKAHYCCRSASPPHERFERRFAAPDVQGIRRPRRPRPRRRSCWREAQRSGILAGVPLGRWYPELADCFLVA